MENNFITRVHDLTGIDPEEITKKIVDIDVDSMLDLLGALAEGDQEKASAILATASSDDHGADEETDDFQVTEGVLGLTCIPDLARIQTLAGLPQTATEIEIEPKRLQPVYDGSELDLDGILDAFERIERSVGDLFIKDAKIVRERLQRLSQRLNESSSIRKRKV